MTARPILLWLRQDLRLADHPALEAAIASGGPVVPIYINSAEESGAWPSGAASRWWLHHSLASLDASLRGCGSRLILRRGDALTILRSLIRETGAGGVVWSRRYEPSQIAHDTKVKAALAADGIDAESFNAALLHEPWTIRTKSGGSFRVFTPFWRACLRSGAPPTARPAPKRIPAPERWPSSDPLDALELLPRVDWAGGLRDAWSPGEAGAEKALRAFSRDAVADYPRGRDRMGEAGTSRLSPHLHFGEIGPRQVWQAVEEAVALRRQPGSIRGGEAYLRQLVWREFAVHILFHEPQTAERPLREEFARFPWRKSRRDLEAWQRGATGYPIVDAGMRELWSTGWMHNRARMIVASFLVKDLLISWVEGARWFWDTLVDADLANNALGWQWMAGCGADAAPYFRIFNPILQGKRFDPEGAYVRRWVPEIADLPDRWIHRPWDAPAEERRRAGIKLGVTYPRPMVNHAEARDRALDAWAAIRK